MSKKLTMMLAVICQLVWMSARAKMEKTVIETRKSEMTTLTLQKDDVTEATLDYSFQTELLEYDDGTSENFLIGKVSLKNLPTDLLYETQAGGFKKAEIRVTVGWRYPWEDAYDLTSIKIDYTEKFKGDETDLQHFKCIDGYSNGSISTQLYDGQSWKDIYGRHNITIKEWTDYVQAQQNREGRKVIYRTHEVQNCKILEASGTNLALDGSKSYKEMVQTFEATYRRPFMGHGLFDVELLPDLDYNITSYFGCYAKDVASTKEGTDPNIFFFAYNNQPIWGCKGSWQGSPGKLYHLKKGGANGEKESEDSFEIRPPAGVPPDFQQSQRIEEQITVRLLSLAITLPFCRFSALVGLALLAFY